MSIADSRIYHAAFASALREAFTKWSQGESTLGVAWVSQALKMRTRNERHTSKSGDSGNLKEKLQTGLPGEFKNGWISHIS